MVAKTISGPTRSRIGSLIRTAAGVSALAIIGQLTIVAAIPVLTRLYSPEDFGIFTIYLSIVNILGAIATLRFASSLYVVEDNVSGACRPQAHPPRSLRYERFRAGGRVSVVGGSARAAAPSRLPHSDREWPAQVSPMQ